MKKISFFIFILLILASCKKKQDNAVTGWTDEEHVSYTNVINLQKTALTNFETWVSNGDSLEALNKVKQFFLTDPSVSSATIGSQGISVDYKNGMCGGLFLNPMDLPGKSVMKRGISGKAQAESKGPHLVNRKDMVLLNPHYWNRSDYTDTLMEICTKNLPKAGFNLARFYPNQEADVEKFTKLSDYGIICVYTHGWLKDTESEPQKVYLMTGEIANDVTSSIYWQDIRSGKVAITEADYAYGYDNIYFLSESFIESHNDFSKDTVIFMGAFCFSGLGTWPNIIKSAAKCTYTGYSWSVYTQFSANRCGNLIFKLCDTLESKPVNTLGWFDSTDPPKWYYNKQLKTDIWMRAWGDSVSLWGLSAKDIDGNVYHTVTIGTQTWMVENLKTTHLNDGTAIPEYSLVFSGDEWGNLSYAAYCFYQDYTGYEKTYGCLYNGYAASNPKLAPKGWHVPTYSECETLINYLGGTGVAGGKLKEQGLTHWLTPNTGATNSSGFTALPGGNRTEDGKFYLNLTGAGFFWTSSLINNYQYYFPVSCDNASTGLMAALSIRFGFSVRCIKD